MIKCYINGRLCYPSTEEKIKVTFENQFINDSGTYTYNVSFPMAIPANVAVFGNVQRLDVRKTLPDYEDCKIYANGWLIMSGKGTVNSISNEVVKLQIVGGKSRVKYNSNFDRHFIDEIAFPKVNITQGIDRYIYNYIGMNEVVFEANIPMIAVDYTTGNFVGQPGVAAFTPVNDETNTKIINHVFAVDKSIRWHLKGVSLPQDRPKVFMENLAMQPYLMYVLKKVVEYEGYSIVRNDFDREPWNRLIIINGRRTASVGKCLPHWTVYTFFEEVRKMFNATFLFDDIAKTVSIISANELLTNEIVHYDCLDEFTCEVDQDGLVNLASSNIEFTFAESANRDWRETIPLEVFKDFELVEFSTFNQLQAAVSTMTKKERFTKVFKVGREYFIYAKKTESYDAGYDMTIEELTQCGFFSPIVRDASDSESVKLRISPVAITQIRRKDIEFVFNGIDLMPAAMVVIPSIANDGGTAYDEMTVDDDGEYFLSVQDAMQGGSDEQKTQESEEVISVAFLGNVVVNLDLHKSFPYTDTIDDGKTIFRYPVTFTDYRMYPEWSGTTESATLDLDELPIRRVFGDDAGSSSVPRFVGDFSIDNNNLIQISFATDEIPDPTKIYVFKNKKFVCKKVELEVSNDGISRVKVGYFYEIL